MDQFKGNGPKAAKAHPQTLAQGFGNNGSQETFTCYDFPIFLHEFPFRLTCLD